MKIVGLFVLVMSLSIPLFAQTVATPETPVSYTFEVRDAQNNAVSTQLYNMSVISCGQAKPPVPILPPLNPTHVYWDDPANVALACSMLVDTQLLAIPTGSGFSAVMRANGPTLQSLYSIPSNRFNVQAVVGPGPITPLAPRTPSGVRIR